MIRIKSTKNFGASKTVRINKTKELSKKEESIASTIPLISNKPF